VLPPALADQIAAGEVVERAASVVKELSENAIDAGAHRIDVDIEGGGRQLVRVVDDGSGMTPDEARLALRRHATSKIRSADDLWGLATFGFRGEALPSIAAVSRLTLATKVPGAAAGFRLTVEAGVETDAREVGIPEGTQIEIRDLFFNTPARLKFQKTEATEAANVSEAVLRLALGHPEIHFRLRAGGRLVLDLPAHQKLGERVRAAFARRGAGALHEAWGEEGGHAVRAFLAAPDEASTTARSTFLFVGRRFIRDRALLHALSLGYGDLLEKGRYPLAALFVDVPGADLDINVHPQKLEVRFARAAEVYAAVRHVVSAGVARAPWLSAAQGSARTHSPAPPSWGGQGEAFGRGWRAARAGDGDGPGAVDDSPGAARPADGSSFVAWAADGPAPSNDSAAPTGISDDGRISFRSLTYIGPMRDTYLVCETSSGDLVFIDRRAAQECVVLDGLRGAYDRREIRRQRLLFPVPVDLGSGFGAVTPLQIARLETLGFEVDGGVAPESHVLLRATPEVLKDAAPKPLLQDLLRQLVVEPDDGHAQITAGRIDQLLVTMAQHAAARAGEPWGRPQVFALLARLDEVDASSHRSPGDRPIAQRISLDELARRFGRR
jgi:DNA mismatch repair protein MutL